VHSPLPGQVAEEAYTFSSVTRFLVSAMQDLSIAIDWAKAERAFLRPTGVPESVMLKPAGPGIAGAGR